MKLIFRVMVATFIVAALFICFWPSEWKRWIVLWGCINFVFMAIMGVIILMGVKLI